MCQNKESFHITFFPNVNFSYNKTNAEDMHAKKNTNKQTNKQIQIEYKPMMIGIKSKSSSSESSELDSDLLSLCVRQNEQLWQSGNQ